MSFWLKQKRKQGKNTYIYMGGSNLLHPITFVPLLFLLTMLLYLLANLLQ